MDLLNFCLKFVEQEAKKFNVDIKKFTSANQITAATANDVNYDITHNRCAYLYRHGTINIYFAKYCFSKFIVEYSDLGSLLCKWNNCPNLTLSTFSKGPAFDYVAFLLAFYESLPQTSFSLFENINMISKYGAWRNTVTIMQQIISKGYLNHLSGASFENCKVIQGDPFDTFSEKIKDPISQSDVIVMIKSIKLNDSGNEQKILSAMKNLLETLKTDAVVFCIDTKPVTTLIDSVLSQFHGKYLLQPVSVNASLDFDCLDAFKIHFGCSPVISARGVFFVWQKLSEMQKGPVNHQTPKLQDYQILDSNYNSIENHNIKVNYSNLTSTPCDETNLITKTFDSASPYLAKHCIEPTVNSTITDDSKNINYISMKTDVGTYNDTSIKHNDAVAANTDSLIYFNKFVQTEDVRVEADSSKIVALTNRITKLTATVKKLLQVGELKSSLQEEIPGDLIENNGTPLSGCADNSPSCSFIQHSKCLCHSHSICCRKECMNHFQNCEYRQHVCLNRNSDHFIAAHDNGYHIPCCNSKFSNLETNQYANHNTPNLIIPLNTLSKDFESLIISSLSKTGCE